MTEPQIAPLLIGGGLTLAGVLISQIFGLYTGHVERKHQIDLRRKQRLEQMADLILESEAWFKEVRMCNTIQELGLCIPPPQTRRVVMIARLSFPSIIGIAQNWANGYVEYYQFAMECFANGAPGSVGLKITFRVLNDPIQKAVEEQPLVLRDLLNKAIVDEAKKYQHL